MIVIQVLIPVLTLIGLWLLGDKKRIAFMIFNACQLLIIYSAITTKSWGILAMSIIYIVFNIINFIKWRKPITAIPIKPSKSVFPPELERKLTENEKYLYLLRKDKNGNRSF